MDSEIKVTSAAEATEIELMSATEGPEIKVTSAAEVPEIELMPATEGPEIKVTSAAEAPEIELTSATNGIWSYFTTKSSGRIFHASARIRYGRESDFEPKLVSIGPYYHERENLKRMEDFKVRCMSDLLKKRPVGGSNIDRVPVEPFMRFESNARRFYKEEFKFSDVEFVEMLVSDSCFVIRIMLSLCPPYISGSMAFLDLNIKEAVSDLLLLENQIPLFFINEVYYWLYPNGGYSNKLFHDLLRHTFMQLDLPWWIEVDDLPVNSAHLLHLYWKISEESINKKKIKEDHAAQMWQSMARWAAKFHPHRSPQKLIANAIELHQMAGIDFENVKTDRYNGGVEFSNGIMRMPCLKIDSSRTTLLVNLIAFENFMPDTKQTISTYIKIMDDLIDSEKDVELLQKSNVIYNTMSSHRKAATFFNDIGNVCLIDKIVNPFSDLFVNVNKYYNSSWNRSWATLRQNYFNSPWSGISVIAGVVLLFLSGVQTYYTVFPKN